MDSSSLNHLPPLKRLRFLHQQHQHHQHHTPPSNLTLPAKKRKQTLDSTFLHNNPPSPPTTPSPTVHYYSLPAKKRVFALNPTHTLSPPPFDLNIAYTPSPEKPTTNIQSFTHPSPQKHNQSKEKPISDIKIQSFTDPSPQKQQKHREKENPDNKIQFFTDPSPQKPEKHQEKQNPDNKIQSLTDPSSRKHEEKQDHCDDDDDDEIVGNEIKAEDEDEEDGDDDDGILCCVCQSTDGDPEDPIVFCDGCDLMVHASCYGNPLSKGIPEGDWFCEPCRFNQNGDGSGNNDSAISSSSCCCLCPVKEGAMKQTTDNRWAHIVCAVFVPEVFFADPEGREGIDCSKVPRKRWLEKCYVCDKCDGCAIVCSEPKCGLGFHVTCGVREELCIEYKEGKKGETIVAGFCKSHSQIWEKQQQSGKYKIVAVQDMK
ncbi:hypothetical protein RIF29_30866 [Crotalaria pallida]|uniref:Uncharacterized protein n=1 Tax=Crotalaria pallida TaxID=3830 RepID=A0AAN9HYH5_CROPI